MPSGDAVSRMVSADVVGNGGAERHTARDLKSSTPSGPVMKAPDVQANRFTRPVPLHARRRHYELGKRAGGWGRS